MLTISRRILISAPRDSVQAFLGDFREVARYEPKVDSIDIADETDGANAQASGRFLGIPWRGRFQFSHTTDGGYRAVMLQGPLKKMECTMVLRPVLGGTLAEHSEAYHLPWLLRPLNPLIRRWVDKTIESELNAVKEGAEALNRRLQLQKLEA